MKIEAMAWSCNRTQGIQCYYRQPPSFKSKHIQNYKKIQEFNEVTHINNKNQKLRQKASQKVNA